MGNDKDPDIIDISDEIKDVIPVEEATEDAKPAEGADGIVDVNDAEGGVATVKKVKKKKKSNNISKKPEQDVSVRQFRTGKKKGLKKALIILILTEKGVQVVISVVISILTYLNLGMKVHPRQSPRNPFGQEYFGRKKKR